MDLIGLGIVIPTLPPIVIRPEGGVLPLSVPFSTRSLILGLIIATFPIVQFFSAPILGSWADRIGRKKVLLVSIIGTALGYGLFGLGVQMRQLWLLFVGRALGGFTGGNIVIPQSSIADISDEKSKARNFGLIGMAFGLGFIIGPFVGGILSDPTIVRWFNHATPFWSAALLAVVNLVLVVLFFGETLRRQSTAAVSIFAGGKNIVRALTDPVYAPFFFVVLFSSFGGNFFNQFFQVFLIKKFEFTTSQVGMVFAYIGLWLVFTQGGLLRIFSRRFSPQQMIPVTMLAAALWYPILLIPSALHWQWIFAILPFTSLFQALTQPNLTAMVSNLTATDRQGEILGVNQSFMSLSQAVPPIIAGWIAGVGIYMPTVAAAIFTFIAWLLFMFVVRAGSAKPSPRVKI